MDKEQKLNWSDFKKIPNLLSFLRIVLSLLIIFLFSFNFKTELIKWIFVFGVATDFLDGTIARRFNRITRLGIVLEPIADTLLVFGTVLFVTFRLDLPTPIFLIYLVIFFTGFINTLIIYLTKRKWFAKKLVVSEFSIFFVYATGIFYLFNLPFKFYLAIFSVVTGIISLIDLLRQESQFYKSLSKETSS